MYVQISQNALPTLVSRTLSMASQLWLLSARSHLASFLSAFVGLMFFTSLQAGPGLGRALIRDGFASGGEKIGMKFPVKHFSSLSSTRDDAHLRQLETARNAAKVSKDQNLLITLNQPFGEFYAVMELGTPPSEVTVLIDTGSDLVWIQCQPCDHCAEQIRDPIYNPATSQDFRNISCDSKWCSDDVFSLNCSNEGQCLFELMYQDQSSSHGFLSQDTLTFISSNGTTMNVPDFVFGCADYVGLDATTNSSGIMGLNRGNHSAPSQLGLQKFSYCLPDRTQELDSTGYITFGDRSGSGEHLRYTRLIRNSAVEGPDQFYYVNLTGISVGGELLDIPASAFEINTTSGSGGTILDTGTALTTLMDAAYTVFRDAIKRKITGEATESPAISADVDTCYQVQAGGELRVPEVILHFQGPLDLALPRENVIWKADPTTYCLAFSNALADNSSFNVIGNFQQQNILVEFNLLMSEVGFAVTNCNGSGASQRSYGGRRHSRKVVLLMMMLLLLSLFFFL